AELDMFFAAWSQDNQPSFDTLVFPRFVAGSVGEVLGRDEPPVVLDAELQDGSVGRHSRSSLRGRSGLALVLGHVGLADLGDQALDQALGRLALGLRLEIGANAVPKDRDGHLP